MLDGRKGERFMKKRLTAFFLTVIMVVSALFQPVIKAEAAEVASGTCGASVKWELNSDGVLTISGKGDMDKQYLNPLPPWDEYYNQIKSVVVKSGVTSISRLAFPDYRNLTSVTIESGVKSIGSEAFTGTGITSVYLPDTVEEIGDAAFCRCVNLETIRLSSKLKEIPGSLVQECPKLRSIIIPNSVTSIGSWAFANTGLESVSLVGGMQTIHSYAFRNTKLTSVKIPRNVTRIEDGAFADCDNLFSATFLGPAPGFFGSGVFNGAASNFRVYYYLSSGFDYPTWNGYPSAKITSSQVNDGTTTDQKASIYTKRGFNISYAGDYDPVGDPSLPPTGTYVKVGSKTYTEKNTHLTTSYVEAEIDINYTGNIAVGAEGYYEYTLPQDMFSRTNYGIRLIPKSEKGAVIQDLLKRSPNTNGGTNYYSMMTGTEYFYQPKIGEQAKYQTIYPVVDWNGHGEGKVYLKQGNTLLELKNRELNTVSLAANFVVGPYLMLHTVAADGTVTERRTGIRITEPVGGSNVSVDMGDDVNIDTSESDEESMAMFEGEQFKIDFSNLSGIPMSIAISENGMVQGTIGFKLNEMGDQQASFGSFKETMKSLRGARTADARRNAANKLENIYKNGNPTVKSSSVALDAQTQVVGYFIGKEKFGHIELQEIELAFVTKGKLEYTHTFLAAGFPFYWEVLAEIESRLGIPFSYNNVSKKLEISETCPLDIEFKWGGGVGAGCKKIVSVGTRGTVNTYLDASLPIVKDDVEMSMNGNLYVVFCFLGIEMEGEICETEERVFYRNGTICWEKKDGSKMVKTINSNDILTEKMTVNMNRFNMSATRGTDGTFVSNVCAYNTPSFASLHDGRMIAAWIGDDSTRGAADKNAVYYSVRSKDGIWSEPEQLENDGTRDSEPRIFNMGGSVWVVWQNYNETYGEAYPEDMEQIANQMKLSLAPFDECEGTFGEAMDLDAPGLDVQPNMQIVDGVPSIAWTGVTNVMDENATEKIYSSVYGEEGWSEPVEGDVNWYVNDVQDTLPEDHEGGWPTMASDPVILEKDGIRAVIYAGLDENGYRNLSAIVDDGCGWGEPVVLMEAEEYTDLGNISAEIWNGQLYVLATIRKYNAEGALKTADLRLLELPVTADLQVESVHYDAETLGSGADLSVNAYLKNLGMSAIEGVDVTIMNGEEMLHNETVMVQILPGEEESVQVSYALPETISYNEITYKAEPFGMSDSNPGNNTGTCMLRLDDAEILGLNAEHTENGVLISTIVGNCGFTDLSGVKLEIRKDGPEGILLAEKILETVTPNELDEYGAAIVNEETTTTIRPGEIATYMTVDGSGLKVGDVIYANVITGKEENLVSNNSTYAAVYTTDLPKENLKFAGASLKLKDDLSIRYMVPAFLFGDAGYTDPYILVELNGKETKITDYILDGDYYTFCFDNISPHQMNDKVYATIYATYNGEEYASATREYSVATYCYNMLERSYDDTDAEFRTLLVDLLGYGSKAQIYVDYKTDELVDGNLTDAQKVWGTQTERKLVSVLNPTYETIENPTVLWRGAGLNLKESIKMRFILAADSIDGLNVKITCSGKNWTIPSKAFTLTSDGYEVLFDGLNVAQLSEEVYVTVYKDGTAVSNTARYSVESYAYAKQDSTNTKLAELVKAMMKYGDAAYNYVN